MGSKKGFLNHLLLNTWRFLDWTGLTGLQNVVWAKFRLITEFTNDMIYSTKFSSICLKIPP